MIDCMMTGGSLGRRDYLYKEDGRVKYFTTREDAAAKAAELGKAKNHTLAKAFYKFTVRKINEDKQMSIGSKFLERVSGQQQVAEELMEVHSGIKINDPAWKSVRAKVKKLYEKKIVEFFFLLGVPGRYVRDDASLVDGIIAGGDILRKGGRKQSAFNDFYDLLKAGYSSESEQVTENKKGQRVQKALESIMVILGFPHSMVDTKSMPGPLNSVLARTAAKIESDASLEMALIHLVRVFGLSTAKINEDVDLGEDDFAEAVVALVSALGIPEANLNYQRGRVMQSLRAKRQTLKNRSMIVRKIQQLVALVSAESASQPAQPAPVTEDFAPLAAMVGKDLKKFNAVEPHFGPALRAPYAISNHHEDAFLLVSVDPDCEGDKTLKVSIDSPWDGEMHAKYFTDDKEGYKQAVDYANLLRTTDLRSGGRPKGWKN